LVEKQVMPGRARIGISGWRYAPWRGIFYPPGLRQADELGFAARHFDTIEINGSFYSLQNPALYAGWRRATPPGFVFSVKGSRYITHLKRLRDFEQPLANFFASGPLCLEEKLGPFLWQFPPQLAFDGRFEPFFAALPRDTQAAAALASRHDRRVPRPAFGSSTPRELRHAVEVRHESFRTPEFIALLRRHRIAFVVADTAGRWPYFEDPTADFVYVRLHGDEMLYVSGYSRSALSSWARKIEAFRRGVPGDDPVLASPVPAKRRARDVYVYFDNDVKVHAPFDAASLAEKLGRPRVPGLQRATPGEAPAEEARSTWPATRRRRAAG
jgi:uncharacterized protein YecE (DUF72 family)